jgi:ketosteroid isomerase-like protein
MPLDLGGVYEGADTTLREVWGRVFAVLDTCPVPDEYIQGEDGRVVVVGHYTGKARETGRPHDAAFVHLLRFRDGAIIELVQVTDTARWHAALAT